MTNVQTPFYLRPTGPAEVYASAVVTATHDTWVSRCLCDHSTLAVVVLVGSASSPAFWNPLSTLQPELHSQQAVLVLQPLDVAAPKVQILTLCFAYSSSFHFSGLNQSLSLIQNLAIVFESRSRRS